MKRSFCLISGAVVTLMALTLTVGFAPSARADTEVVTETPDSTASPSPDGAALQPPLPVQPATPLVGWLDISGSLRIQPRPYTFGDEREDTQSLAFILRRIREVATHKRYLGLLIHLDQADLPLSQIDEIGYAIRQVRDAGKKVFVYSEAYDLKSYLLACSADGVFLRHKGQLELAGLGVEEMYLAGLLEKVGAKADFIQVGRFKGAAEPLTNAAPSPEWSQNFDALLDDLYGQVIDRIAKARGMDREKVEKVFNDCWSMSDEDYVKRGLIDRLVDRDMVEATEVAFGDDFEWEELLDADASIGQPDNPFAMMRMLFRSPKAPASRPTIAVVHANGQIISGDSQPDGGLMDSSAVGSRTMDEVFSEAMEDEQIKGIVLRIDSPGGSALASEVIWQTVRRFGEEKPVYVSIGSLAASGGYYIASAGHVVYISPTSIVGSIGVVGGKITLGGLYEKIGVNITRRSRGPMGDMFNSVAPFTPEQKVALLAAFERTYDQFLDRVSIGRGKRLQDVKAVAEGRLFTGRQAVANGMADKEGGLQDAITGLAAQLKLKPGSYDVIEFPKPMSLSEYLEELFDGMASAPGAADDAAAAVRAARAVLGPEAWRSARPVLSGLLQLRREHVLTLMPMAIVVR